MKSGKQTVKTSRFFLLILIVSITNNIFAQKNVISVFGIQGSAYINERITPKEAMQEAIIDAKKNALMKAGIGEYLKSSQLLISSSVDNKKSIAIWVREYFKSKYNVDKYDTIVRLAGNEYYEDLSLGNILEFFNADKYVFFKHQDTHAANSLYQSPHDEALIVSCDGGGDDGFFVTYHAVKGQPLVKLNNIPNKNLGMKYAQIGTVIPQIKKSKVKWNNYYTF